MKQIVPELKPAAQNWSPDQIAQDLIDGKYDGTLSDSFQLLSKKQLAEVIKAVAAIQHNKRGEP